VLIHGVGMHADYWSNLIPALETHFSLLIIDMPGHGQSPELTSTTKKIEDFTNCIAKLLSSQEQPVFVAGHSMGALISVDLASRYSKYVRAIAVLNGTLERWFGSTPQGVDAEAASLCHRWLSSISLEGYRDAYRAFAYDEGVSRSTLSNLECPALFTTGELEPNSTPAMSESMASLAPLGAYYEIKNARHMMSMTHGKQLSDVMTSFFTDQKISYESF